MSNTISLEEKMRITLDAAEFEAIKNLGRYKFAQFGYFAARWVTLNRLLPGTRPSPFKALVKAARALAESNALGEIGNAPGESQTQL